MPLLGIVFEVDLVKLPLPEMWSARGLAPVGVVGGARVAKIVAAASSESTGRESGGEGRAILRKSKQQEVEGTVLALARSYSW